MPEYSTKQQVVCYWYSLNELQ